MRKIDMAELFRRKAAKWRLEIAHHDDLSPFVVTDQATAVDLVVDLVRAGVPRRSLHKELLGGMWVVSL